MQFLVSSFIPNMFCYIQAKIATLSGQEASTCAIAEDQLLLHKKIRRGILIAALQLEEVDFKKNLAVCCAYSCIAALDNSLWALNLEQD